MVEKIEIITEAIAWPPQLEDFTGKIPKIKVDLGQVDPAQVTSST